MAVAVLERPATGRRPLSVLFVDDDAHWLEQIQDILKQEPVDLRLATCLREVRDECAKHPPIDIAVLDVRFKERNRFTQFRSVVKQSNPNVDVIALSDYVGDIDPGLQSDLAGALDKATVQERPERLMALLTKVAKLRTRRRPEPPGEPAAPVEEVMELPTSRASALEGDEVFTMTGYTVRILDADHIEVAIEEDGERKRLVMSSRYFASKGLLESECHFLFRLVWRADQLISEVVPIEVPVHARVIPEDLRAKLEAIQQQAAKNRAERGT